MRRSYAVPIFLTLFRPNGEEIFTNTAYFCRDAAVCTFLWNVSPLWSMIAGAVTVIVIRLLAAHFRWNLPQSKDV